MEYIDYDSYVEKHGAIDKKHFDRLEYIARKEIDYLTFNRIVTPTNDIKACMNELIYFMDNSLKNDTNIVSEKVANYSVTYANVNKEKEVKNIIRRNLLHTGLLYRGVYRHDFEY